MQDKNEEAIFDAAMELDDPAERARFVARACAGDGKLLADVEALLRSHDSRSLLDAPLLDVGAVESQNHVTEGPGTVIGRYKLLEKIGEGGMAVVYMAEQEQPIRRKVALKIIKLGMDTKQVIARFEAERQALALMDHPSIAKVLDAGATETGRPYFVMELVQGVSITEYCDRNSLSTKDRLALFVQICNAVQHAHQKGIIHRDIKPSNVMVTHHDGKPVPKVIDFGIAKATNQRLAEKTLFTRYAHIIGTPAYMSPEQAELSDLDIDTRSDIYSLGVLLYELLTRTTPFSEEELRKAGYLEMQRIIREQEPVKPSTRIRTAHVAQPPSAGITPEGGGATGVRGTPYQQVRGDLDWIVMKSLEKDRARRYETASALAEDVRRHLDHEPVLARSPGTAYRVRKFLRRHRVPALVVLTVGTMIAGVAVVLSMWNRDRLQLVEAEGFKHRGILSQAREQYAKADREGALETIKTILQSRHVGPEAQLLHAGILVDNRRSDEAANVLNGLLNDRPEIAGAAHSLLARILWESESPNAEKLKEIEGHRRQAEAFLPETAEAYFLRAMTAMTIKEQLASLDEALRLDPGHYESRRLRAFTYYASRKYERMKDDSLAMTILRPRDPLGYSLHAVAWRELGHYREAIADLDMALALTPKEDPQYIDLTTQRSEVFLRMGDYERVIAEAPVGAKHLSPVQYHVFCALTALGDYDKATTLFGRIISPGHEARREFQDRCAKYVFGTLEAGRAWHPADREPAGAAFLPMMEAEETYRDLLAKGGRRVTTDGFSARWSPDGRRLAFSMGVQGYSGVAIFDPATQETDLLIVPGKDPRWSPDGKHIAFVRDRQNLRLEELVTPEPGRQQPPVTDEEVWLMKSDGTEPRRLAQGSWPSWGSDSGHLYYLSRADSTLCSVSLAGQDAETKRIMKCPNPLPSVSPDDRHVAYFEAGSLKIKDLASQETLAECRMPSMMWGVTGWSPSGNEVCLGGGNPERDNTGLWLYDLQRKDFLSVLDGQITATCWSPGATQLTFCLGTPHLEIWSVPLDPGVPTAEALGPGQTLDEHLHEMLAFYTRRIEADPNDAYAYSSRARYYDCLHDRGKATADMRQWSAVLTGGPRRDSPSDTPRSSRRVISISSDCEFVFSAERPVNEIPVMSVAFGQKGRCEMKLFEIPMVVASILGLGFLSGVETPAHADFTFGEPVNLRSIIPILDPVYEVPTCFSYDGLEVYIWSERPGGHGGFDLWVSRRASTEKEWGPPENLGPAINTAKSEGGASISKDGLTLYFASDRPGGYGGQDIYMTTRAVTNAPWGPAANLGPKVNSSSDDACMWVSADDLELYFQSTRAGVYGDQDIYVARRPTRNAAWSEAVNLGPLVNSPYAESDACLSPDGLVLFFSGTFFGPVRPGGYGNADMWMTRRASRSDAWQVPENLGHQINTGIHDIIPRISPDGSMLIFSTNSGGVWENWQVPILPVVDFNGDGKVDGKEVLAMAEHWGQSKPLCDIGVSPLGDGVVDVNDLTVLAGYIGTDVNDPTLIAHWAMDEAAGTAVHNTVGGKDGMALGNPTWQPVGGKIGGALACDGVDDFVLMQFELNPAKGPFSVLAWVKGGAPGEVVLSQQKGADWLYANPIDGSLMTGLMGTGTAAGPGFSDVVITDGQWHRIGLVWDGTDRILLVDGKETARDAQSKLTDSTGTLILGTGKSASPASFWSGLIDDVRIYNRAVQP